VVMLIQVVLAVIMLIAFAVIVVSYSQYIREGGEPYRPWFVEQSTPRGTQLAMRSKKAAIVAWLSLAAIFLLNI